MTRHKSQDERRAQILAAARRCFIRTGYAHTRVDDIAAEAGLSKGGVYFHFPSKREIFDALYAEQQGRTAAVIGEAAAPSESATERLARLGAALVQNFGSDDNDHGKFLIVLAEMGIREPDVLAQVASAHWRYVDVLAKAIDDGTKSGELRAVDPKLVALCLKLMVDGVEQALALGYEFDRDAFVASSLDLLFNGLRAR
ncbi:MAG: TetR/AcrR family transcriptional regulator [Myxococcales bacterium]|nr:TetR/AcrR family transcriptional regulator [Myxococcales bacterium]MCB9521646.1 TetR/AcrR family transcriptional regulator [Myxococcales bacterium]MCB9531596.1 TetR/AcrR family transcriptional regulator [Myxococcales bacterium]MCB9532752.1 TetR/AcrR family transcriptional regulator [Myxococcales bacterium]